MTGQTFSPIDLAALGMGRVAYVRAVTAEDVKRLVPQAEDVPTGIDLYALLGADGTPILITESREDIAENAAQHNLVTVTVH
jgi:hypothetical protein